MNRFAPARPAFATLLVAAALVSACGKAGVAPQATASAQAGTVPADACEKLKARMARCKAHMKNGSVEFKLDPGADSVPELCQESEKMVDGIAQMTGCESN